MKTWKIVIVVLLVAILGFGIAQLRENNWSLTQTVQSAQNWFDQCADRIGNFFGAEDEATDPSTEATEPSSEATEPSTEATEPEVTEPAEPEGPVFVENTDGTVDMERYEFMKWARDNKYGAFNVPHYDVDDRLILPGQDEFQMFKVHFIRCEEDEELNHDHEDQEVEFMLALRWFSVFCCDAEEHGFDVKNWDELDEDILEAYERYEDIYSSTRVELCTKCEGITNVQNILGKVVSEELTDEEWADLEKIAYYWWELDEETDELVRVFGIRTCSCGEPAQNPGGGPGTDPTDPGEDPTDPTDPSEEPHEHEYTTKTTAPTCEEGGYTTYTCACGDSYVADETDPLGHEWGEWVVTKQPTPDEDGLETCTCNRCGKTKTNVIPSLGRPDVEDEEDPTEPDPEHNDQELPSDEEDPEHNLPEDPTPEEDENTQEQPDVPEDEEVDLGSPDTDGEPEEQPEVQPDPDHNDQTLPSDDEEEPQPEEQPDPEDSDVDLGTPDDEEDDDDSQVEEQPAPEEDDVVDLGTPDVEDEPESQPEIQPEPDHNAQPLPSEDEEVTDDAEEQPAVSEDDTVDLGAPDTDENAESQPEVTEDDTVDLGTPDDEEVPEEQPAVQEPAEDVVPEHNDVELPVEDETVEEDPQPEQQPEPQPEEEVDLGSPIEDDVVDLGSPE